MCGVSNARQRSRGWAAPVARAVAEMVIAAAVTTVVAVDAGAGAGMVLTGRRKATNVTGVVNWATGPMNAGPKPRRSRLSARRMIFLWLRRCLNGDVWWR
jgi:hypothetical protein